MTNPTTPQTPAGWFPDEQNPGILRWWDGYNWTEHRQPQTAQAWLPAGQAIAATDPRAKNNLAYSGLVLGLAAFIADIAFSLLPSAIGIAILAFVAAALAIVFGVLGVIRASRLKLSGLRPIGRGAAVTGIVLGGIFLLAALSGVIRAAAG